MANGRPILPASTNPKDFVIATIGSHSALQILKGARDEGFRTLAICKKGSERVYDKRGYDVADEIISLNEFEDWNADVEEELIKKNAIIIPHGSFIAYVGIDRVRKLKAMYYGTKEILQWESDRTMERQWLEQSGLMLPRVFSNPDDIEKAEKLLSTSGA